MGTVVALDIEFPRIEFSLWDRHPQAAIEISWPNLHKVSRAQKSIETWSPEHIVSRVLERCKNSADFHILNYLVLLGSYPMLIYPVKWAAECNFTSKTQQHAEEEHQTIPNHIRKGSWSSRFPSAQHRRDSRILVEDFVDANCYPVAFCTTICY